MNRSDTTKMHGRAPVSVLIIALGALAAARRVELRWTPARETGLPGHDAGADGIDVGISPVPTQVPGRQADLAAVELFKRYNMGTDTCGFAAEFKCEYLSFLTPFSRRHAQSSLRPRAPD